MCRVRVMCRFVGHCCYIGMVLLFLSHELLLQLSTLSEVYRLTQYHGTDTLVVESIGKIVTYVLVYQWLSVGILNY